MNDQELHIWIQACRQGDSIAQYELYKALYGFAYKIATRYTGQHQESEEVTQDSFYKLFTRIDQYTGELSFLSWFKTIIIHTCIDRYRSKVSKPPMLELEHAVQMSEETASFPDIDAEYLVDMIKKLPPAYRLCLNMYAIEGYEYHEIAEQLKISIGAVKSNIAKARMRLKHWLSIAQKNSQYAR
ncbi:MAG: sigma-70 family RNA polymerase sigma factor [Saprospiraceae bacterium]|nr:sigma-70 family RNA polymerase sigma factor [Saprospiraceae bacterium]